MSRRMAITLSASLTFSLAACEQPGTPPASFVPAALDAPVVSARNQLDPGRERVWRLERDGLYLHDLATARRTPVHLEGWQWAGEPYGCLPGLALGPKGEAIVASNVLPVVWRVDAHTLSVSVHPLALDADTHKDVGFSAIVYSSEHAAYFGVSDIQGSLWRIDPQLARAQKIALSGPLRRVCELALGAHVVRQRTGQSLALCAGTPGETQMVDLAADQRSGYVRATPCTGLPLRVARLSHVPN